MDLSRFVRITRDGSATSGGTGYLLHGDLVLTARHVVAGANELVVHYDGREGPAEAKPERVVWEGKDDLDVAVLAVKSDRLLAREVLTPRQFQGEVPWRSRGWARVAPAPSPKSTSVVDGMSGLGGRAYEFSATARRFEVGVDDPPKGVEWWKGVSGAPVFSDRWLLGVIAQGEKPFEGGRLDAIPIAALWKAPGFLAAIGIDASWQELRERRRRDLVVDLTTILTNNPEAAWEITVAEASWRAVVEKKKDGGAGRLAVALCDAPSWRAVLETFDRVHESLWAGEKEDKAEQAETIVQILDRVLPEIYATTSLQALPAAENGLFITLPIETSTLAEVAMAAVDGRGLAYDSISERNSYPLGRGLYVWKRKGLPTDLDISSEGALREFLLQLAATIKMDREDQEAYRQPERLGDLAGGVNAALEREVRQYREPRRYFAYPSSFREACPGLLVQLREKVPALHLVELAAATRREEREQSDPLRSILFRSFDQKRKKGKRRP